MDDRGLRPRHNRNPSRRERAANIAITLFCVVVGTFNAIGLTFAILQLSAILT